MKHNYSTRLLGLVSGVALLGSCTNDNMVSESSTSLPVSKQEVTISCFDTETTDIGTLETRTVTPPRIA